MEPKAAERMISAKPMTVLSGRRTLREMRVSMEGSTSSAGRCGMTSTGAVASALLAQEGEIAGDDAGLALREQRHAALGAAPVKTMAGRAVSAKRAGRSRNSAQLGDLAGIDEARQRLADDLLLGGAEDDATVQRHGGDGAGGIGGEEAVVGGFGGELGEGADGGFVAEAVLGGAGGQHQRRAAVPGDRLQAGVDAGKHAVAADELGHRAGDGRVLGGKIAVRPAARRLSMLS